MAKATEELLGSLHELAATTMLDELTRLRAAGEAPSPQLLSAVAKFLKDNNISADPTSKTMAKLVPFVVEGDEEIRSAMSV